MCKEYLKIKEDEYNPNNIIVYEDEGFSAKNMNRPMFKKMIQDIKNDKIDKIICYKLDRLSRNVKDFSELLEILKTHETEFISIKENFDTSTPIGRAMIHISSVFAQLERETIAERIRDSKIEIAKNGRWQGGTPPLGYISKKDTTIDKNNKKRSCFYLDQSPDISELNLAKEIFELYIKYKSINKVKDCLMINNIKSKNDKYFSNSVIKQILLNPVYVKNDINIYDFLKSKGCLIENDKFEFNNNLGIIAYRKTGNYSKEKRKRLPFEDWIVSIGKHKGIISGEDWIKVINYIDFNKKTYPRANTSNLALFSGLIKCTCGSEMIIKNNYKNKHGDNIFYYQCKNRSCNIKNIRGDILDKNIIESIQKILEKYQISKTQIKFKNNYKNYAIKLESNDFIIKNKKDQIENLINITSKKNISDMLIKKIDISINKLSEEIKYLEIDKLNNKLPDNMYGLINYINEYKNNILNRSIKEKQYLMKKIIKFIYWDGNNIDVVFKNRTL